MAARRRTPRAGATQFSAADIELGIDAVAAVRTRLDALAESSPEDPQQKSRDDAEIEALRLKQEEVWARASVPARFGIVLFCAVLAVALVAGVFYGCGINTLFGK